MFDYLIIGGGVAGLTAGAHLATHGRVCLLEGEDNLAHHASSRSAAVFIPAYGTDAVTALSRASETALRRAEVLSPRGGMIVGMAGEEAAFDAALTGFGATEVSPGAAAARVPLLNPDAVTRAGVFDHAWDIDTDRLMQGYAKRIRATGAVQLKARVDAIHHEGPGHWRVEAGGEIIEARVLINAAGAWADVIAHMAGVAPIGLTPKRRSMARIEVPGGFDPAGWPMIFGGSDDWYAKPDAGALIVSPSDADPLPPQDAWADDMVLAEGLGRFQERITHEVTRMLANWAGLRSFAPDGDLVIGPEPDVPDFVWMAGQGGYGFQTAPAAGRLLAARALGIAPEIDAGVVAACEPARLRGTL